MRCISTNASFLLKFSFIAGLLGLTACGPDRADKRQKIVEPNPYSSFDPPLTYELDDAACQSARGRTNLSSASIWGWQGLSVVSAAGDLEETYSDTSLSSKVISATSYGRGFSRECDAENGGNLGCVNALGQSISYLQQSGDNFLRICKDDHEYPRETYEGVALTSTYYINRAGAFYQQVMGKALSKIRLDVLPLFQTIYRNFPNDSGKHDVATWLTNNLAYYPGNKLITVFPETKEKSESSGDHYWESSFVLAHELGHHIEENLVGSETLELGITWNPELHAYSDVSPSDKLVTGGGDSPRAKMWSALSEGFADLNGFYTNDADSSTMQNIACIGRNRDVNRGFYYDDTTQKRLTLDVAKSLVSTKVQSEFCGQINFTDPHIVGASIAYALDQIFSAVVRWHHDIPEDTKAGYADERAKLNYKWYIAMAGADLATKKRDLSDPQILFQPLTKSIEQAVEGYVSGVDVRHTNHNAATIYSVVCNKASELMPILGTMPFAQACSAKG